MKIIHIFLVVLVFAVSPIQAAELKPYTGTMHASEFILKDMQGKTHRLSGYRGKVVLVNFWATWCPPCIEELPSLQRLLELYEGKDFTILTIDVGEPAELIRPFLSQVGVNDLTVLLDADGTTHKDWNIYVFPTNFLLDQSGKIRYAAVGALNWDEQNVIDTINKLLE
ncbi:MAG: TlpA family protein disulfide reductase [Gammaproteobacteria bacterium]|nr:TlpA family protein disulfide reductase [Gammaproteobacteria bacterium]